MKCGVLRERLFHNVVFFVRIIDHIIIVFIAYTLFLLSVKAKNNSYSFKDFIQSLWGIIYTHELLNRKRACKKKYKQ
jgi:hypothetical protein